MRVRKIFVAMVLVGITVGCGGGGPESPVAPTPTGASQFVQGATIVGRVQSVNAMLASTIGSASPSLTVTVLGTGISTNVGPAGQFTLTGVPAGGVQLQFSGPGVNATLTLSPVQGSETITITVKINGSHAQLEDESHEDADHASVNGVISELTGTESAFQFRIGTRLIMGNASTTFFGDGNRSDSFDDLDNGDRVEVKGTPADGYVLALRIHINPADDEGEDDDGEEGDEDEDDQDAVNGTIAGLSGSCPTIAFTVSSTSVATDASTEFKGGACSTLSDGVKVQVKGTRQSNGTLLAREVRKK